MGFIDVSMDANSGGVPFLRCCYLYDLYCFSRRPGRVGSDENDDGSARSEIIISALKSIR